MAALLTQCGVSANIDTLKNARRRGELALGQIHVLTQAEITFARTVYLQHPDCPLDKLVAATSPAAADLAASQREASTCAHCGVVFTRERSSARYCGAACRKAANKRLKNLSSLCAPGIDQADGDIKIERASLNHTPVGAPAHAPVPPCADDAI